MSRKNATEQLKRLVANSILDGATQTVLVQQITEDVWNLGYKGFNPHSAKDLIAKVRKQLREDWADERKELQVSQLHRLMDLFTDAKLSGDRMNALNALKEINKMCGLYEPDKIEAKIDSNVIIDFGFNKEK